MSFTRNLQDGYSIQIDSLKERTTLTLSRKEGVHDRHIASITIKGTACCGIQEVFGFEVACTPAEIEMLLGEVRRMYHGSLLWVFVKYEYDSGIHYAPVMRYLIDEYQAQVPQAVKNPNTGHTLYPLVHALDVDDIGDDWEDEEHDDESDWD